MHLTQYDWQPFNNTIDKARVEAGTSRQQGTPQEPRVQRKEENNSGGGNYLKSLPPYLVLCLCKCRCVFVFRKFLFRTMNLGSALLMSFQGYKNILKFCVNFIMNTHFLAHGVSNIFSQDTQESDVPKMIESFRKRASSSERVVHQELPPDFPLCVKPGTESKCLQSNHSRKTKQNKIGLKDSSGPKKKWNALLRHHNSRCSQVWQLPSIRLSSVGQNYKRNLPVFPKQRS